MCFGSYGFFFRTLAVNSVSDHFGCNCHFDSIVTNKSKMESKKPIYLKISAATTASTTAAAAGTTTTTTTTTDKYFWAFLSDFPLAQNGVRSKCCDNAVRYNTLQRFPKRNIPYLHRVRVDHGLQGKNVLTCHHIALKILRSTWCKQKALHLPQSLAGHTGTFIVSGGGRDTERVREREGEREREQC